jgi:hypothetical protein
LSGFRRAAVSVCQVFAEILSTCLRTGATMPPPFSKDAGMDWNLAIEINRTALKRVLAALVAMAGGAVFTAPLWGGRQPSDCRVGVRGIPDDSLPPAPSAQPPFEGEAEQRPTLPRHLHRAVLRLLRPAEAAARRLIIVSARGLVVPPARLRPRKTKPPSIFLRRGDRGTGIVLPRGFVPSPGFLAPANRPATAGAMPARRPGFRLLDPLPRHRPRRTAARSVPRISLPGFTRPFPVARRLPTTPADPVDATRLALRLQALESALDDLPGHARRFARWRARAQIDRDFVAAGARRGKPERGRFRRVWPLRMGRPACPRGKDRHEIHAVLADTHGLALWALADTS